MEKLFKSMRRQEKIMCQLDTEKIVHEAEFGTLACCGSNGYPYSVPVNYAWENGVIYIHSAREGGKLDSIAFNNKVSFSIVNYQRLLPDKFDTEYESVIIFGEATLVVDVQEKRHALTLLIEKYSHDFREQGMVYIDKAMDATAVIKVNIQHMTGKRGR